MRHVRLAGALAATALAAAACGTAGPSTGSLPPADGPGSASTPPSPSSPSSGSFAARLLDRVPVPASAARSARAPSKALEHLPAALSLPGMPTVVTRFWTVGSPARDVYAWLGRHDGALGPPTTVAPPASGDLPVDPVWPSAQFRTYEVSALPPSVAVGQLYVGVAAVDPGSSAIAAYAVTLAQAPSPRPASEVVPTTGVRAVVGWSLAPGGTPVRKPLTGAAAARLARDFNALRVAKGAVPCPMIPDRIGDDVTVTFTAGGHRWQADIPVCPSIRVTRDGHRLPALDFGQPFLRDVRAYAGHLPWDGPPAGGGEVTPLLVTPSNR